MPAASRGAVSCGLEVSADSSGTISGVTALSSSFSAFSSAFSSFFSSFLSSCSSFFPSRAPKMLTRRRDRERLLFFDLPASAPPTAVVVVEGATAAIPAAGPLTATLSVGNVPSWTLLPSILFFGREATAAVASADGLAKSLLAGSIPCKIYLLSFSCWLLYPSLAIRPSRASLASVDLVSRATSHPSRSSLVGAEKVCFWPLILKEKSFKSCLVTSVASL